MIDPTVPSMALQALQSKTSKAFLEVLSAVESALEVTWNLRKASVRAAAAEKIAAVGTYRLFAEPGREVFVSQAYADMRVAREDPARRKGGDERAQLGIAPRTALEAEPRGFCLLGQTGGGKSTILMHLAVQTGEGRALRGLQRIPHFRRAQHYVSNRISIKDDLCAFFELLGKEVPEETATRALDAGYVMIVVDGIDEVEPEEGNRLVREMSELAALHGDSVYCCSGRPLLPRGAFTHFGIWEPLPLSAVEQENFVRKWFAGAESTRQDALLDELIQRPDLRSLGSNPLLLSLICANRRYGTGTAEDEAHLLRKVVTGLMGGWDYFRTVQVRSQLYGLRDPDVRALVPAAIAKTALEGRCETGFDAYMLENLGIRDAIRAVTGWESPPPVTEMLKALWSDYGILTRLEEDVYVFVHQRVAEWCAAYFYWRSGNVEKLASYLDDARWSGVIALGAQLKKPDFAGLIRAIERAVDLESTRHVLVLADIYAFARRFPSAASEELAMAVVRAVDGEIRRALRTGAQVRTSDEGVLLLSGCKEDSANHLEALGRLLGNLPTPRERLVERADERVAKAWLGSASLDIRVLQ